MARAAQLLPRLPQLPPERAALVLTESFFLPLIAGMVVRRAFLKIAAWTAGRLIGLACIVLALGAVALLAMHWHLVLDARY